MSDIKFQASEPSGSEEEDFLKYFLCISIVQTLGRPGAEPFWTWGPLFIKLGKRLLAQATYRISST